MLVFGATDHAAAVATTGSFLGYRVTVCDARAVFATRAGSRARTRWSSTGRTATSARRRTTGLLDERTVVCVLSHDPKFDVPVLEVALRLPLGYVGAMGSRRTADGLRTALRDLGVTGPELDRLSSPIGLDLGARTPEETAVAVAAEIIVARTGRGARPLRSSTARSTGWGTRASEFRLRWPPGGPAGSGRPPGPGS